jgi:hypothetical protein
MLQRTCHAAVVLEVRPVSLLAKKRARLGASS